MERSTLEVEGLAAFASALLASAERAEVLGGLYFGCQLPSRLNCHSLAMEGLRQVAKLTLGTTSPRSSMTMRPRGEPLAATSKKTWDLDIVMCGGVGVGVGVLGW